MSERQAALVTGGAIRVGLHFAKTLAAKGYDIAIHYNSSADKAEEAAVAIRAMGVNCAIFPCDFLSGRDPSGLIDDVAAVFPHLSVLVNCASIYNAAPVAETTMAVLQNEFMVNFFTPFLLSGAFARRVERGNIVNILDNKIAFQQYQYGAYLSAKKALGELTKMTAMEFAPRIRVNGIAPGVIMPGVTRTDEGYSPATPGCGGGAGQGAAVYSRQRVHYRAAPVCGRRGRPFPYWPECRSLSAMNGMALALGIGLDIGNAVSRRDSHWVCWPGDV